MQYLWSHSLLCRIKSEWCVKMWIFSVVKDVTHSFFTLYIEVYQLKKLKIIRCINKAVSSCQLRLREWCSFCIIPVFHGLMWRSRCRRLWFDHDVISDRKHVSFLPFLMLQHLHFFNSSFQCCADWKNSAFKKKNLESNTRQKKSKLIQIKSTINSWIQWFIEKKKSI